MSKVTRLTGGQRGEHQRQGLPLHEIPSETDTPLETVGQHLRAARLRRGDELGRISQILRIRKDYLEAIETDRTDKLPGRTYAIGFVRSYAGYLGLDGPGLVARFKGEIAGQAESLPQVGPAPAPERRRWGMVSTVLVLLFGGLLVYGVDQMERPARPIPQPTTETFASTAKLDRTIAERAPPRIAAAAHAALPAPQGAGQPIPAGEVFGAKNSDVRVVLRARAPAHVLVQDSGGKVYINRLLHPGDVYRVPNLVGLSLTTPDGGAVALELDGQGAGVAGQPGQTTEALSLDPQAIVDHRGGGIGTEHNKVTQ
jgi:cytoskeleton protein RodZ